MLPAFLHFCAALVAFTIDKIRPIRSQNCNINLNIARLLNNTLAPLRSQMSIITCVWL